MRLPLLAVGLRSRLVCVAMMLATTGVTLSSTSPAFADAESDAKDLFARARELRNRGDCAGASPLFYKAWRTYPQGLGNLRNYAECEEQLGRFASARRGWLDLKRALLTAPRDAKYEGWEADAEQAAARLKPKVAQVTVDVTVRTPESEGPANERSGVELLVNGEPVTANLIGTPLERDPGTYTIRVQAPDAQPVEQSVDLGAGDSKRVSLRIVRTPPQAARAAAVPGDARPSDAGSGAAAASGASPRRTLAWAAIGVGGASLIGSGVTFLLRQSALGTMKDECGPTYETTCAKDVSDTVSQGKLMSTLSPILLGVGVLGVGAGVALLVTTPKPDRTGLTVYPGLGRIDATWRF